MTFQEKSQRANARADIMLTGYRNLKNLNIEDILRYLFFYYPVDHIIQVLEKIANEEQEAQP